MKKYDLIREGKLFRIIALKDFGFIKKRLINYFKGGI